MAFSAEERKAFVSIASKMVACRELLELKAQQLEPGELAAGNKETVALANQMTRVCSRLYQNHQIGGVRFRGSLFIWNAMNGSMAIIPERRIETIEG